MTFKLALRRDQVRWLRERRAQLYVDLLTGALRSWLAIANITSGAVFRPVDRHGNVADRRLTPSRWRWS
ncbi:MAG TPA: hypothetical protein VGJ86_02205 [Acidimicrobiales bacterium]